jgi:N-acetyl sugar amidotransferase
MITCTRCLLVETHETVEFDADGVCNVCRNIEYKRNVIDWDERRRQLDTLVAAAKARGDRYDCIIPFSGGKDSQWQLWFAIRELGLKPLVVRANHWGFRPKTEENNTRTFKLLGCDVVDFKPNYHVWRELMLLGMLRRGDFCLPCHQVIACYPMHAALQYRIPLVLFGESTSEYTAYAKFNSDEPENWDQWDERRYMEISSMGMTPEDMVGMLGGRVTLRDLEPFGFPEAREIKKLGVKSLCLGNYIPWDTRANVETIRRELGWQGDVVEGVPPQWDYDKVECIRQGARDALKYIKRKMGRTTHLASIDIRHGRMTREEGAALEAEFDGKRPASLDYVLGELGMTEDELIEVAKRHAVGGFDFKPGNWETGPRLWDSERWDRTLPEWPDKPGIGAGSSRG